MHYIALIVVGLIAGGIAKMLIGGDNPTGWIVTAVLGIVGAFLGKYLLGMVVPSLGGEPGFNISTVVSGVIGSGILLVIYHFVQNAMSKN